MSSSALRGALLVAVAALLGFLILRGATDTQQFPVGTTGVVAAATPTPSIESTESVTVAEPTAIANPEDARNNSDVSVMVANGTDVSGQAGRLTEKLRNQGFLIREPKNANSQAASVIYYRPGFAAEATVVRNVLGVSTPIAPMPSPDPDDLGAGIDLGPVNVLVLVGADDLASS